MKRKTLMILISLLSVLLAVLLAGAAALQLGWQPFGAAEEPTLPSRETVPPSTEPPLPSTAPPETVPVTTVPPTTAAPATEPKPEIFRLSFAGDCTLGTMYEYYSAASGFPAVVGEDYAYPFANVQPWFASDDFTMVNLEGPLTEGGTPADKTFVFRGDPALAEVLSAGSVEWVSLANNHAEDFGREGYESTEKALKERGILYGGDEDSLLVQTDRGLKIGLFSVAFYVDPDRLAGSVADLRQQGAEVVVVSFHWGIERDYRHSGDQQRLAHAAVDAGADIVFGHHPHVLQEIEHYGDGVIYYSLGNFSFGGNANPNDYDTAVISQQVIREPDGTVHLGEYEVIPCSVSSADYINNYQPTPAAPDSDRYRRVMDKLAGRYEPPATEPPATEAPETEAPSTEAPETEPSVTEAPSGEIPAETPAQTREPVPEESPGETLAPAEG